MLGVSRLSPLATSHLNRLTLRTNVPTNILGIMRNCNTATKSTLIHRRSMHTISFANNATAKHGVVGGTKLGGCSVRLNNGSPILVFRSTSVRHTLSTTLFAVFSVGNRHYATNSHVFVRRDVCPRFIGHFTRHTGHLHINSPGSPGARINTLVDRRR